MRKILTHFVIFIVASSSVFPVSGCTFNFYGDCATNAAIKSFSDQTSNIVKSLVLGKEKSMDTAQTITEIYNKVGSTSINNLSNDVTFNNLGDFTNVWGENKTINFEGFDPNDNYFVATGKGSLTATVNAYQSTINTLNLAKNASSLGVIDNSLLYGQLQNNNTVKNAIFNFFNKAKQTDSSKMDAATVFLRNLILGKDWTNPDQKSFQTNLVQPGQFLLDYLVDNKWSADQPETTPTNLNDFKTFMSNWKAPDGSYYSQWNKNGNWELVTPGIFTPSAYDKNWNQTDFNFYRSGCLINWLFYKIGKDYNIINPDTEIYKDRYLGDILTDHLINSSGITKDIDLPKVKKDLGQYTPYILKNPLYLITIAQAIIPIIKYFGLDGDVVNGTKNLTFGNVFPTDKSKESYNFLDLIKNIQDLLNNHDKLNSIVTTLVGKATTNTPGQAFLYDIQLQIQALGILSGPYPISYLTQGAGTSQIVKFDPTALINLVMGFIDTPSVKGTVNTISDVYDKWVKNYNDKGQGINISLDALRNFLVGKDGLLSVINQQLVIDALFPILKNDPATAFDQAQYDRFYQGLGGQLPPAGGMIPLEFKAGSVLDILKNDINNPNTPLGKISLIFLGNSTKGIAGLFDIITNSNTEWIQNNYTTFFDANNQNTGKTYNQTMISEVKGNITSSTLQYNFSFTINNKTYVFLVKCISHDDAVSYKGTKTFRFTDIDLLRVTSN